MVRRRRAGSLPPPVALFDARTRDLLGFVDQVVTRVKASDACFAKLRAGFSEQEIVEIVMITGFYQLVCGFLENLEVELEEGD